MARTYKRDRLGRFASTGSSGRVTGGTLRSRTSLRNTKRKRAGIDPADQEWSTDLRRRALKGAETRGRNRLAASRKSNRVKLENAKRDVFRPNASKKAKQVSIADVANGKRKKSSASGDRRQVVQSINGKKVVVELKRAKAGGEYGPDGHFYPGGAWMSLGKYQGGAAAVAQGLGGAAGRRSGSEADKSGQQASVRNVRNREPEPPPIAPIKGRGLDAPKGLKKRAQRLDDVFFDERGFVRSPKVLEEIYGYKGRNQYGMLDFTAALSRRIDAKTANQIIAKIRNRTTKKEDFDWEVYNKGDKGSRQMLGYYAESYRKRGETSSKAAFIKAEQLNRALQFAAGERKSRRRTGLANVAWTINGTLMQSRR